MVRALTLEYLHFYQLFGDEEFYQAFPEWSELADQGREASRKALTLALQTGPCTGCGTIRGTIVPVMKAYIEKVYLASPELQARFVDFITRKVGFRPRPLGLYHEQNGKPILLHL